MDLFTFVTYEWPLFSVLAVLVAAFLVLEKRKGGNAVSYHEATRMINQDKARVVDVRDANEFKSGHIVDSVNIPFSALKDRMSELEKYKNSQIIVVDKMGQHAGSAGKMLRDAGFNVVRMRGGVSEWSQQNLPLVKA